MIMRHVTCQHCGRRFITETFARYCNRKACRVTEARNNKRWGARVEATPESGWSSIGTGAHRRTNWRELDSEDVMWDRHESGDDRIESAEERRGGRRGSMMQAGIPFDEYIRAPGMSATAIKAGVKSMKHMRHAIVGPRKPQSPAMKLGTLIHAAILEPKLLSGQLLVLDAPRNSKQYKDAAVSHDPEWIVTSDTHAALFEISAAVHANHDAHHLIANSEHEVSCYWEGKRYGKGKARFDGFDKRVGLFDVKTTKQIAPSAFERTCYNMGYHLQFGWYWTGARLATGDGSLPFHVIAIEQDPPYDCSVYRVPFPILEQGRDEAIEIAARYRACEAAGSFPGVTEMIEDYALPSWACGGEDATVNMEGLT